MDKLKSRLLQGKFQYLIQPERAVEDNWTCSILRIDTIKDSFGCLRPVYILDVCDGIESFQVAVSAIA